MSQYYTYTGPFDELTAQQCASLSTTHPDYGVLASRILISNHQKNTPNTFKEAMSLLYHFVDVNGKNVSLIGKDLWLNINNLSGTIPEEICNQGDSSPAVYNNKLCPPYPDCISQWDIDSQDTSECP